MTRSERSSDPSGRSSRPPACAARTTCCSSRSARAPYRSSPGAITFQGATDAPVVSRLLDDAAARLRPRIAFAVGPATSWPLPLYELALLTAGELRARGARCEITLVTPEAAPLELFGTRASAVAAGLLADRGITVIANAEPLAVADGALQLVDGRSIGADRVVALPRAAGRFVAGLPHDHEGFIPVDPHGRVDATDGVYAAGDITTFPFKQGGLATQQADAAAEAMLAELGLPIEPQPFSPVLQGVLYTGGEPAYMRAPLGDRRRRPRAPQLFDLVAAEQDRRPLPLVVPHRARRCPARAGDPPGGRRRPGASGRRRGPRAHRPRAVVTDDRARPTPW